MQGDMAKKDLDESRVQGVLACSAPNKLGDLPHKHTPHIPAWKMRGCTTNTSDLQLVIPWVMELTVTCVAQP